MFLSFGIIQSINSHTARDKGLTNVGVWVSVGLNGDTCCLSHSFFVQTLLLPSFPVSFDLFCCLIVVLSHSYWFLSVLFSFPGFSQFFFFLSAIGFPFPRLLLQIRCLLFISFSLLSRLTEIGFFLLRKQYFYSNSN